jgi:hypothetical protein
MSDLRWDYPTLFVFVYAGLPNVAPSYMVRGLSRTKAAPVQILVDKTEYSNIIAS